MRRVTSFFMSLAALLCAAYAGGPGRFDSVNGTYDEQTNFAFDKTRYYQMLTRTVIGALSKGDSQVASMVAGEGSIDGGACILGKKISEGDMVRHTLQEAITGLPSYGDQAVARGDFLAYQNQEVRVNQIDSPAIPVQGRMARQRAKFSLTDIPGDVEQALIKWCAQEIEYQAFVGLIAGASPAILKPVANGGLGDTLGVRSSGTAAKPLMGRHWYTPQGGYLTFSTTQATYNATVNTAVGNITAGAAGYVTLAHLKIIRRKLDQIGFAGCTVGGKRYKAVVICDPDIWWRIDHLLATYYQNATPRADDNKIFGVDHQLVYDGMLFICAPNLEKFRIAATSDGTDCISWGVGAYNDVYASDPRTYSNSNATGLMMFLGQGGLLEGYNDRISTTSAVADHNKGLEYAAHFDKGYKRGDWYAQDGRTGVSAALSYGCFTAAFYEPGVGTGY